MDDDRPVRPRPCRSPWTAATAEAVIMAPYGAARQSEYYDAAKHCGDARAAYEVVLPLVNREGQGR